MHKTTCLMDDPYIDNATATRHQMTATNLRNEYFTEMEIGTIQSMDATEQIPAGGAFGGDAPVYTGHQMVARCGGFSTAEAAEFAALFD